MRGSSAGPRARRRDLGDDGPDPERRFAYLVTYERELVIEAARSLMARVTG